MTEGGNATNYQEAVADILDAYIEINYPVRKEEVDQVIEEAKSHETQHIKGSSFLFGNRIFAEASNVGIDNLPKLLLAVKEMEKDIPFDQKLLTPKKYVELLATAEITTAHKSANSLKSYEGVQEHLSKAIQLLNFRNNL